MDIAPVGKRLNRREAAEYLNSLGIKITAGTLCNLACHENAGNGPPYTKTGWRTIFYEAQDLRDWANRRMVRVA